MQLWMRCFVLVVSLVITACVSTYKPADGSVAGYRDVEIDQLSYFVEYTEAASMSWAQIEQFALKRCAEIAKSRGYLVFDAELLERKTVFLESSVDEIAVASMGNIASDPPVHHVYKGGAKVEGKRVTYKLTLIDE